jgi:hypothetical protein
MTEVIMNRKNDTNRFDIFYHVDFKARDCVCVETFVMRVDDVSRFFLRTSLLF